MVELLGRDATRTAWRAVDELIVKTLIAVEPTVSGAMEAHLPAVRRGEPNRQVDSFLLWRGAFPTCEPLIFAAPCFP